MAKPLSVTLGIPTCNGAAILQKTIASILRSRIDRKIQIIIAADTVPFTREEVSQLNKQHVTVIQNKTPSGQQAKLNQLARLCTTDLIIFTQDDVLFSPTAIQTIIQAFEKDSALTMVAAHVAAYKPKSMFEKILLVGSNLVYRIGMNWNSGNNYLLSIGRCLAFRTDIYKRMQAPGQIVNADAYVYFANRELKGKFAYLPRAVVYTKLPQRLQEHINQSKRYQNSYRELKPYISSLDHIKDYHPGLRLTAVAFLQEFLSNPLYTFAYIVLTTYVRTLKVDIKKYQTAYWKVDRSTKLS